MTAAEVHETAVRSAAIARLTEINLEDLVSSFGWQGHPLLESVTRRLLREPAQAFARQIVEFDTAVGEEGLVGASRRTLPHYVREVRLFGREHIPAGPFLALANHPGLTDALSLFGALNRSDLLVVALERPFLQVLSHASKRLASLSEERSSHAAVIRKVATHLRAGGAALSFPAGRIEPDPDVHDGATESLQSWTQSAGMFVRLAPEAAILPVLVRGVVWPMAAHNWLTQLRRCSMDREKVAAALQLLAHLVLKIRPVKVTVQIGHPIYTRDLGTAKTHTIHQAVMADMSRMIQNLPDTEGQKMVDALGLEPRTR